MKRVLIALAVVSMINMVAGGALLGVAWSRKWLEKDRVRKAWAIFTGEEEPAAPTTMPAESAESAKPATLVRVRDGSDEFTRTELERRRREIQNGWELLERQQLALLKQKEDFEETKKRYAEEEERRAAEEEDAGFKKELEIIAGLKPKAAKEFLRLKDEADVVRVLMRLEPRTARKIVAECKTSEERQWMGRILEKLHQRDAIQAEVLAAGDEP